MAAQGQVLKKWRTTSTPPPPREGQAVGGGGKAQAVAVDLDRKDIMEKEEAQPGNLPGGLGRLFSTLGKRRVEVYSEQIAWALTY